MAHDPSHRANALIIALCDKLRITSPEIIYRASLDNMAHRMKPMEANQVKAVMDKFNEKCTTQGLQESILQRINSQQDGTPGLKILRDQIFAVLAKNYQNERGNKMFIYILFTCKYHTIIPVLF